MTGRGASTSPDRAQAERIGADSVCRVRAIGRLAAVLVAIMLQWGAVGLTALLALLLWGSTAAWSAALGGLAAAVPNSLFAVRLGLHRGRRPESYPVVFFIGEFVKVGLTILLFGAAVGWDGEKHWPALILGLIIALKAPLFALWWYPGNREPPYCRWKPGVVRRREPESDPDDW